MTNKQFKNKRQKCGLTQKELAVIFDVTKNTIQNYEYGLYPIPKVIKMAFKYYVAFGNIK